MMKVLRVIRECLKYLGYQFVFVPSISSTEAIFLLIQLMEKRKEELKLAYIFTELKGSNNVLGLLF